MKLILVAGARPNFMKVTPIYQEIERYNKSIGDSRSRIHCFLVHTGQHYDYEMDKIFFRDLVLPKPHFYLGVGSGLHSEQTAKVMMKFEDVLWKVDPDMVIVVGDVNSTLACALATAKYRCTIQASRNCGLKPLIAHVEAGLRSFDFRMPEEINRKLTDHICDILFTHSKDANENLRKEGISEEKIFFVGDVMVDSLLQYREKAQSSKILEKLGLQRFSSGNCPLTTDYCVLTLHRAENVDNRDTLIKVMNAIKTVSKKLWVIFPVHPRTQKRLKEFGLVNVTQLPFTLGRLIFVEPLGYLDFLKLMSSAKFVMTDSGGIQVETTILGIPCLTLRQNTERPITITEGTNILVGNDIQRIVKEALNILVNGGKQGKIPELWDGKTAERIVKTIVRVKEYETR